MKRGVPEAAVSILDRLTAISSELSSAFRPSTVVDVMARAFDEPLHPSRLSVVLLDLESNHLTIVHDQSPTPTRTDDPLLQLALRKGPLVIPKGVAGEAAKAGSPGIVEPPASWIGAPLLAVGRAIGAVSIGSDKPQAFGEPELAYVKVVCAKAAIALANARLVELLSVGKREWELTADSISQAICIVDGQGIVRRANRVFADLIQVPVTALPGRAWLSLVPPAWADVVSRVLEHPGAAAIEIRTGDRVFAVGATRMAGADIGTAVLLFDDTTDRHHLQDQLIQSEKMSAMGQLIAGVAHDLNNPLASVVGFSDFLAEAGEIPPALAEPLQVIRQEAERAATIVRNLLSFARKQEGERQSQSIRPLLESTLALLRNQLMALKVEAALEIEPGIPPIGVNANQIKQVFVNLIVNAAQAIASTKRPGGGHIWITARRWLDGCSVSIADDGPGIPEDLTQRVFEPFFTTKPEGQGTGLGLSISQGIVKEHGGRITLDSAPNQGATFTVELPGSGLARTSGVQHMVGAIDEPLRVLVVDDEPHILHYMRATLEAWGHSVEVASDGSDAVDRAIAAPFDVIVCDLRMPRLGGREMYEELAEQHPEVADRVIFATGDTVRGDTLAFLESLGRPFLHKPFTLAELRTVLGGVRRAG
ncbi:MAG TPA: ATP-binding protein [Gemmatimonadales bacterium]|nr:ATP-binding protein [Gemmatimonadales bacterium]